MADDDLLDPSEIEALLKAASSMNPPPVSPPGPASSADSPMGGVATAGDLGNGDVLTNNDIEALLKQRDQFAPRPSTSSRTEKNLARAEAGVAAALAADLPSSRKTPPPDLDRARSFEFQDFGQSGTTATPMELQALQEVELDLRIELGRAELLIEEVLQLREGSVVPLDKLAGDPVDILVNGRLVARGEVLVLNDNFCVRVAEILVPPSY